MSERHDRRCGICRHAQRREIEQEYLEWKSPAAICCQHGIRSRNTLHLHIRATRLDERRNRNIRALVVGFIEKGLALRPTAATFIAAINVLAKLDAAGRMIDTVRLETAQAEQPPNPIFERMSRTELLRFAESGSLPGWLSDDEKRILTGTRVD